MKLKILNTSKIIYNGDAESITVNHPGGQEGYLSNHADTFEPLVSGTVTYQVPGESEKRSLDISGGFLIFKNNSATLFYN